MKLDMHCHTKEGSLDGKVSIEEYIVRLKELGYDGMLITDHNSCDDTVIGKNTSKDRSIRILWFLRELSMIPAMQDTCWW